MFKNPQNPPNAASIHATVLNHVFTVRGTVPTHIITKSPEPGKLRAQIINEEILITVGLHKAVNKRLHDDLKSQY